MRIHQLLVHYIATLQLVEFANYHTQTLQSSHSSSLNELTMDKLQMQLLCLMHPCICCCNTINGHKVLKETTVLINTWAILRDPNVWEEPTKFKPERFEGIEVGSEGFKFLTFGKGKRSCPGSVLAVRFITLTIGTLIQGFDWKRLGPELLDMEEKPGLTMHTVKPLEPLYRPCQTMINSISEL